MKHFSKYNAPHKKDFFEYLLAIAIQLGIFLIMVFIHNPVVKLGGLIQDQEIVNGATSSPTTGRLVYLIVNPFLIAAAIYFVIHFNKKNNDLLTFIFANIAGILLWQFFGEDFWHFSVGAIHFVALETIEALPLIIILIALIVLFSLKKDKNFGLFMILIVFAYNWLGHYITEGFYPLVESSIPFYMWAIIASISVCVPVILFSLYLGIYASKDTKGRYISAILTFASVSILIMSIIHSS